MDGKKLGNLWIRGRGSNRTICCLRPRSVLLLSCILWAEALQVLCLCWEAGSWDTSSLGRERRVGSGPRSRGPLSLFPLCLPRPNSPWVYVIRPKWVTVCTPAVWLCLAEGTSLPRRSSSWKGTGGWDPGRRVRCSSLRTPSRLRRWFRVRSLTSRKASPRNLMVFCVLDLLGERGSSWPPRPIWITRHPSKWLFILNWVSLLQKYAKKMIFHHC